MGEIIYLTSKENSIIKIFRKLSVSKRERAESGKFVTEGARITADAIRHGFAETVLVTRQALDRYADDFPKKFRESCRVYGISDELAEKISLTESAQGVFAVCRVPEKTDTPLKADGKYVVLFGLQDPGNVGMIIRTADAMGVDGVLMCGSCELYAPKTVRATMGSIFRTDVRVFSDEEELFGSLKKSGVVTSASVLSEDSRDICNCSFSGGQAVFLGNEGSGLPSSVSERCDRRIKIPMHGSVNSLNVAMAGGIFMWEMTREIKNG